MWRLDLASELLFVGDAGTTEASRPSRRTGIEWTVVLDVFNLLNARASDIDYFYRSRLSGEPSGGVDDIHAHPALPRTARLVLRVQF